MLISYALFHPVAYIVKLNIELTMADLIAKIARSTQHTATLEDNEFAAQKIEELHIAEVALRKKGKEDVEILQIEHACYSST